MKRILLFILILPCYLVLINAQGIGFGYMLDVSEKNNFKVGQGYNQSMETMQHNFFLRFHKNSGLKATQFQFAYRKDSISFSNYSQFLSSDGVNLDNYNVEAYLKRHAWKFGYLTQYQFGPKPGKFIFAVNYGFFYEYTAKMYRHGISDEHYYELHDEINRHNLIFAAGFEMRFRWFTVGYKFEKMFFDVLNHDYINSQLPNLNNSSDLRGMRIDPAMSFLYVGINFDIY